MNRRDIELVARSVRSMAFLTDLDRANVAYAHASDLGLSGDAQAKFLKQCGVKHEPAAI